MPSFELRYLIGSDRRTSPVRFTHRNYRGQRTARDDFHPECLTFLCPSYQEFQELFAYEQKHTNAAFFPVVELYDPETKTRLKITGNETVFLTSDLAAIASAVSSTGRDDLRGVPLPSEASTDSAPPEGTVGTPARLTEPAPEVSVEIPATPTPSSDGTEGSVDTPVRSPSPAPELAAQLIPLVTAKKRTLTDLSNELGLSKEAIAEAVRAEDSGLKLYGHWVGLPA